MASFTSAKFAFTVGETVHAYVNRNEQNAPVDAVAAADGSVTYSGTLTDQKDYLLRGATSSRVLLINTRTDASDQGGLPAPGAESNVLTSRSGVWASDTAPGGGLTGEQVDDRVAGLLVAGSRITLTYNDGANTLTIDVSGLVPGDITGLTEAIQDVVGAFSTDSATVDFTYDDTANTLTAVVKAASIDNTHIATAAAIAYSKLALTGAILNADLAGSIANSKLATDPLARANHTGTQIASTVSDFAEAVDDRVAALIVPGSGIIETYDDAGNIENLDAITDARLPGLIPLKEFGTTTLTPITLRAYFLRFVASRSLTIAALGFSVSTAATLDDPCDVGIYAADGVTRLGSSGATTGKLNATGAKSVPLTAGVALTAGTVYYAAFAVTVLGTGSTITARTLQSVGVVDLFGSSAPNRLGGFTDTAYPLANPSSIGGASATLPFLVLLT